jgi:hypothetical protein
MKSITARIIYDPSSNTSKHRKWWSIAQVDFGFLLTYKWLIEKEMNIKLVRPIWRAHVSITRGELPRKKQNWKKFHRNNIVLTYDLPQTNGYYWWLPISSKSLVEVRKSLGLSKYSRLNFHLTIGTLADGYKHSKSLHNHFTSVGFKCQGQEHCK